MEWTEYLLQSEKTLSDDFHGTEDKNIQRTLHAVMGILTEAQELLEGTDAINCAEECGDILWYFAILGRDYGFNLPNSIEFVNTDPRSSAIGIIRQVLPMLDMLKKYLYYGREFDNSQFNQHSTIAATYVIAYLNSQNVSVSECMEVNINKLRKRYGDKFSQKAANVRDLEGEREVLELITDRGGQLKRIDS